MPLTLEPNRVTTVEIDGRPVRICNVPGCGDVHRAHGVCFRHYQREYRAERRQTQKALGQRTKAALLAQTQADPK